MQIDQPIVCELFAGVGGMSLGAARAGFDLRSCVELDQRALNAHHRNFPHTQPILDDVSTLTGKTILDRSNLLQGGVDGLIGGPPCQGFSTIGRRKDGDSRNDLFGHFFRLVKEIQPRFFLAENVLGILDPKYSETVSNALKVVSADYNVLKPLIVKASDYGAPTSRKRVFFVGFHKKAFPNELCESDFYACSYRRESVSVRSALRGLPAKIADDWRKNPMGRSYLHAVQQSWFLDKIHGDIPCGVGNKELIDLLQEKNTVLGHTGTRHSEELKTRYGLLRPGEQDPITKSVRLKPDGFCPTLRAGTGSDRGAFQAVRPIHYRYPRVITPREAARLQSFPDWFVFDNTKWHSFRQIGNSVPPLIAEQMLAPIANVLLD